MEAILVAAVPGILSILMVIIASGITCGIQFLKKRVKNEEIKEALDIVSEVTSTIVGSLNQTMAQPMKEAASDGKLKSEEKLALKTRAIAEVKAVLGTGISRVLKKRGSDLEKLISHNVEEYVGWKKK